MTRLKLCLVALFTLVSCTLSTQAVYPKDQLSQLVYPTSKSDNGLSINALRDQAQVISVKIIGKTGSGSGVIVGKKDGVYTVLTNAHVLGTEPDYQVQTVDSKIYHAQRIRTVNFQDDDLGLLAFKSSRNYAIATIAQTPLAVGDQIFAAGFPGKSKTWSFTTGKVNYILPKTFHGGYQIGYSNDILAGMSGGPVVNQHGKLIAVNGRHKHPLWGNPFIFLDGSTPTPQIRSQFEESSWAVSMQVFLHHASQFASGNIYPSSSPVSTDLEKSPNLKSNLKPNFRTLEKPAGLVW